MGSLYKLITKTNLKSPTLAFPLVMPIIFILLYSTMIHDDLSATAVTTAITSIYLINLSVTTMQSGLMGFGINFIRIKKSVLLRRIGATELSKWEVVAAVLLFGLTLWAIQLVWTLLIMIIFSASGLFFSINGPNYVGPTSSVAFLQNINWGMLILSTIIMVLASYSLGLFFTICSKNDQMFMGLAMLYFFAAGFFGGLLFPGQQPTWMAYVGYLVPHSYINDLYTISSYGDWQSHIDNSVTGWTQWKPNGLYISDVRFAMDILIPIIFTGVLMGISVKTLKFD